MTRRFNAHFQNGVLVPDEKIELPENKRLTVIVNEDDTEDPRPAGGVELIDWRARHRLEVTPDIAKIATDPEFDIENS